MLDTAIPLFSRVWSPKRKPKETANCCGLLGAIERRWGELSSPSCFELSLSVQPESKAYHCTAFTEDRLPTYSCPCEKILHESLVSQATC